MMTLTFGRVPVQHYIDLLIASGWVQMNTAEIGVKDNVDSNCSPSLLSYGVLSLTRWDLELGNKFLGLMVYVTFF